MRLLFLMLVFFACNLAHAQSQVASEADTSVTLPRPFAQDAWISKDKADHLVASAFLTGAQYYLWHRELEHSHEQSLSVAIGTTIAIGLGKEIYDHVSRKGTPSVKDMVADVLGIGVAALLLSR
ncbi:hypothetical protein HUU05_27480 [candidate division KSB1 bacterium]|nr:hypothetical protein [candidate division KSB1 bacterium]